MYLLFAEPQTSYCIDNEYMNIKRKSIDLYMFPLDFDAVVNKD